MREYYGEWFRHKNAMQRDKATLLGRTLALQQALERYPLIQGGKLIKYATLQGGIDNLFNKSYAEFVSKGADPSAGLQTVRVNEPGRQYWLRLQVQF